MISRTFLRLRNIGPWAPSLLKICSRAAQNPLAGQMRMQSTFKNVSEATAQEQRQPSTRVNAERLMKSRHNEKVVCWRLYGNFHRHNTLLSLVAVVEDLDFMEKNPDLSYNDKVLYYLQLPHQLKLHVSAGQLGFRKAQRAEYEAGYQVSSRMFKLIEERKLLGPNDKMELIMKDFGKGREAFLAALQGKEGSKIKPKIVRLSDDTKLKFGGVRSKKLRRL